MDSGDNPSQPTVVLKKNNDCCKCITYDGDVSEFCREYGWIISWTALNLYNIVMTFVNKGTAGLCLYLFQLTHITSWLIGAVFLIGLFQISKDNKHFSNFASFVLILSVMTDIMFWVSVYPHTPHLNGWNKFDIILMHVVMTVLLVTWLYCKKQLSCQESYQDFSNGCYKFLLSVLVPIIAITGLYLGWTWVGECRLDQTIYPGSVLDWKNPSSICKLFGKAAMVLFALAMIYHYFNPAYRACGSKCKCLSDDSNGNGSNKAGPLPQEN